MSTDVELSLSLINNLNSRSELELSSLLNSNSTISIILDQLLLTQLGIDSDDSTLRHLLLELLVKLPSFFQNYAQLITFAQVYQRKNTTLVAKTMDRIFKSNPGLLDQVLEISSTRLIEALRDCNKGKGVMDNLSELDRITLATSRECSLARSNKIISSSLGQSSAVLSSLASHYTATLSSISPFTSLDINQRIPTETKSNLSREERKWLEIKLEVLETTYIMLDAAFLTPLEASGSEKVGSEERSAFIGELCDAVSPLLGTSISSSSSAYRINLVNQSLLADLEYYYNLSERILFACGRADENGRELSRTFSSLRKIDSIDGLNLLRSLSMTPVVIPVSLISCSFLPALRLTYALRPKKQEVNQNDLTLAITITEVQDLFPDLSSQFLHQAFAHPTYASSSSTGGLNKEKLIVDLLENNLPTITLRNARKGGVSVSENVVKEKVMIPNKVLNARSVFSDRLDVKNLRIGGHTT